MMESVNITQFMQVAKIGEEMEETIDAIRGEEFEESRLEAAVAFEEAFANVVMHAYDKEGPVAFTVNVDDNGMDATIIDKGIPYDPTTAEVKEMTDEFQVGGHGIRLMQNYVEMEYQRVFDHNLLKIKKNFN